MFDFRDASQMAPYSLYSALLYSVPFVGHWVPREDEEAAEYMTAVC